MFFSLILENSAGDQIDMTATANQYMTSQIEGLSRPPGTISTSSYADMQGAKTSITDIYTRLEAVETALSGVEEALSNIVEVTA